MAQRSITINFDNVPPWIKGGIVAFGGAAAGVIQSAVTAEHFNWSPESVKHTAMVAASTGGIALVLYFVKPPAAAPSVTETVTTTLPKPPAETPNP